MLVMTAGIIDVNGRVIFFAFSCSSSKLTVPTKSVGYPIYWEKIASRATFEFSVSLRCVKKQIRRRN